MGFFDREENSAGALADQLSSECRLVSKATGQSASKLLEAGFSAILGFLIAMVASWQISLAMLAAVIVALSISSLAAMVIQT